MQRKTPAGLHVVHMKVSEKEPVPEFEAVAKCDQHNGEVSCARKENFWACESSRKIGSKLFKVWAKLSRPGLLGVSTAPTGFMGAPEHVCDMKYRSSVQK